MTIHRGYQRAGQCTQGPTTGARGMMSWYLAKYSGLGGLNAGIYNCRPIRGGINTSLHGEGRAVDFAVRPYGAGYGTKLAEQLRLHSAELGIQCIIWNRKIFSGGYESQNWQKYSGINAHVDHLHVELTWTAARRSAADQIALMEKYLSDSDLAPASVVTPTAKPATVKQNSGNSRAENIAIAKTLNALGFAAGVPDGVPGTYLRDGVKAYQRAQAYRGILKVDGDWGPMWQKHFDWVRGELQPNLNLWDASQRVSFLLLDGNYGPLVKKCVKACQTDNFKLYRKAGGSEKDGLAGPITCKFMKMEPHPYA